MRMGTVRRLHRIRVLVAGHDRRFTSVIAFLLSRSGFDVDRTREPGDVLDLIERRGVDVVILDGTRSLGTAARLVAAVESVHPHVGVVLVAERRSIARPSGLRVLPKWGTFERLVDEVEGAYMAARRPGAVAPRAH